MIAARIHPDHSAISTVILTIHLLGLNTALKISTYNLLVPLIAPCAIAVVILSITFSAAISLLYGFTLNHVESWEEGIAIFRESFLLMIGSKASREDS